MSKFECLLQLSSVLNGSFLKQKTFLRLLNFTRRLLAHFYWYLREQSHGIGSLAPVVNRHMQSCRSCVGALRIALRIRNSAQRAVLYKYPIMLHSWRTKTLSSTSMYQSGLGDWVSSILGMPFGSVPIRLRSASLYCSHCNDSCNRFGEPSRSL